MRAILMTLVACTLVSVVAADEPPSVLLDHHHWKRLKTYAESRLKTAPNDAEANYYMGRVLMRMGDPERALTHAEKAASAAPQNAEYRWLVAQAVGESASRASVLRQMGLARRFRREVETVLQMDPKHVEGHYGLMLYYFKAPGIAGGDRKKAYAEADAIMNIDRAKGYLAQVRLAQEEKQTTRLEELYRKAIEADPKEYDAHIGLLNVYASAEPRNAAGAEKHARAAIAIQPDRSSGYSGLAWALAAQQRWNELDALLAEAEAKIPDDLIPYFNAGALLQREGHDPARAERYLRKYLTQPPELGRPSHAVAHWRLGLLLEKAGRKQEAITAIETAVRLDPAFEPAKKDLKRLRS